MNPNGYSGTPLNKKLGIKPGCKLKTKHAPGHYKRLLAPLPEGVVISPRLRPPIDLWHVFVTARKELATLLPIAMRDIRPEGMIWISWPKKSSSAATDVTENVIRAAALPLGLVDVKVCALDEKWSGLKLVIRKELRNR